MFGNRERRRKEKRIICFHWPFPITNNVPQYNNKKTMLLIFYENDKSKRNGLWRNSLKTVWNWHCSFYVTSWPNIKVFFKFLYCFWPGIKVLFFLPFFFFFSLPLHFLSVLMTENLLGLMIWLVLKIEQSCQELCVICGGHRLLWS